MELLSSDSSDSEDGGAQLQDGGLKVNEQYARKFEYNKKREEKHRRKHITFFRVSETYSKLQSKTSLDDPPRSENEAQRMTQKPPQKMNLRRNRRTKAS